MIAERWARWICPTTNEILDRFARLPGAVDGGLWVYIPGALPAESRALLCAHADTVGRAPPRPAELAYRGGIIWAPGQVLGADDRAGCAMLWELRKTGHSLLVLDYEEAGGIGAENAAAELGAAELGAHAFAIEFDRRGAREAVFYSGTHSPGFESFLSDALPRWAFGWGSYTDIATLCPTAGICGVNLAVGYQGEHTRFEYLVSAHWLDTRGAAMRLLSGELPRFEALPDPWDLSDPWGADDAACPQCGLSTAWIDPAFPYRCPDCGDVLPDYLVPAY